MAANQRKPYDGRQRKLIIAFDIGTTFSGVSYAFLIPGEPPVIHGVTQFPGQQRTGGDSKIPSIVCYDGGGNVVAVGSETDPNTNLELLEVEGLTKAEWFKLHLRPPHLAREQGFDIKNMIMPLPPNKTVIDIFADILRYLYRSTKDHIQGRQGTDMWQSVGKNIEFVLSHPNGWEGKQQSEMRRAAVSAGLVTNNTEALARISFVTEGEASLHFCLEKIPSARQSYTNDGIMVVDCGGGTIDISTYVRTQSGEFKEIAGAECLFQGSIFVKTRAQAFLTEKLRGSKYGDQEEIERMTKYFDTTLKPIFKGPLLSYRIPVGGKETHPHLDIKLGNLTIYGPKIAEFFEPSIRSIIQAIEDRCRKSTTSIKTIYMVGGFAQSNYLFSKLDEHFKTRNMKILRPDAYLNKAVAEGSVSFKIDHSVTSRVSRYTYGIESCPLFNPSNPDHVRRAHACIVKPSGQRWVPKGFSGILLKDTEVSEEKEFREPFRSEYTWNEFQVLSKKEVTIKCYRDRKNKAPSWIDTDPDLFPDLCVVSADVSGVKRSAQSQTNLSTGALYYNLHFDVIFLFGLTELKAQIAWKENGVEKRGPASIVYDVSS
ncbi:hypothetical protein AX15_005102 [Amanita polypyramis BW_CC]|nr:hypothetical protein AX15_005102 [Amanita polypyramis BW_CC]